MIESTELTFFFSNRKADVNTVSDIIGEEFAQVRLKKAQIVKDKLERSRVSVYHLQVIDCRVFVPLIQ